MSLDVLDLDNTDYDRLVEEARKVISVHADDWTNHNPQDPGIAILEALAWVTETYTYQFNRVTDAHRRKYLQLMGDGPRPPRVASARIAATPPAGAAGIRIPAGEALVVHDGSGTAKRFETTADLVVTPATVRTVVTDDGMAISNRHGIDGRSFRPFGVAAAPGSTMMIGFEGDPFQSANELHLTIDYHDANLPDPAPPTGAEPPEFEPSVAVDWEYCTAYRDWPDDVAWSGFGVRRDDTDTLYRGGTIVLERPDGWAPDAWGVGEVGIADRPPGLMWIRCRVDTGGYEIPPQLTAVRVNTVRAVHRSTVDAEPLSPLRGRGRSGDGDGRSYRFQHAPVLEAEISVDGERWMDVAHFDAAGPADPHYVLDREAGIVRFGDGVNGRRPEPGSRVVADRYVHGGGDDGNVPRTAIWAFADAERRIGSESRLGDVEIEPIEVATGGRPAESLDRAFRRVRRGLRRPARAITKEDYRAVALATPGLRVGRATVQVGQGEGSADERPPAVAVVVVPYAPSDVPTPAPSKGFLATVRTNLDRRRLLTDRVTAKGPEYVGLDLDLEVRAVSPSSRGGRAATITTAIREYLHPIHGYDGAGWPFGRSLSRAELVELLEALDWVDDVEDISMRIRGTVDETSFYDLNELTVEIHTANRTHKRGA